MLRPQLEDALKHAMKAREQCRVATIRLILAALKDRDIAERGKGNGELDDGQILALLQTMIRQRRESIEQYERGGRVDLAEREAEEIVVIRSFMPPGDRRRRYGLGRARRRERLKCVHDQGYGPHDGVPQAKVFGPHGFRQGERAGEGAARLQLIRRGRPPQRR